MEANKINSLFICRKCKSIPSIEIVPKECDIKILLSCKCNKQLLIRKEIFYKQYYNDKSIDIENNKNIDNENFKNLLQKYEELKNHFMDNFKKIKEQINNLLNNIIQKSEIIIEKNKKRNEEIDEIIQILFKNYSLNPNNEINKENIIKNININPYQNYKEFDFLSVEQNVSNIDETIQLYFKENYLAYMNKYEIIQYIPNEDFSINLNDNIFASVNRREKYINIFDINDISKNIIINGDHFINYILTDEKKKYLISLENDYLINFRNLNKIIQNLSNDNYNKKDNINNTPIFAIKHKNEIKNLINLENNLLGLFDEIGINIYKYDIENKSSELINKLDIIFEKPESFVVYLDFNYYNFKLIKIKNKNFICSYINHHLNIYSIPSLKTEKSIKIKEDNGDIFYEQISLYELIFASNNCVYIINIENEAKSSFISKIINFGITSLRVLKDNTILIGEEDKIRRLYAKTLEDLPFLISFDENNQNNFKRKHSSYTIIDRYNLTTIFELEDGKLILISTYVIKIYGKKSKEYFSLF